MLINTCESKVHKKVSMVIAGTGYGGRTISHQWTHGLGSCSARCLYFPVLDVRLTVRVGSIPDILTKVAAFVNTGDAVPAVFSVSTNVKGHPVPDSLLDVDIQGIVRWKDKPTEAKNLTAKIKATFQESNAEMEVHISVQPALKDPCNPPLEELCFAEGTTYQVSEDMKEPKPLGEVGPVETPCNQPYPHYTIRQEKMGKAVKKPG
ncbi:uncharacterized protein, partial [Halyomorpha halys]|uniref:uncharacterized protein n=1 Tax=Halyomorpha halys TaxID=286706 RepID=UPI0006D5196D